MGTGPYGQDAIPKLLVAASEDPDLTPRWAAWASRLLPAVVIEAVIAWLDAGAPDPDQAAARVGAVVRGTIAAAARPEDGSRISAAPPPGRSRR